MKSRASWCLLAGWIVAVLVGCSAEATDEETGASASSSGISVGGYTCPQRGEITGRTIPDDERYYLTTFGGGRDAQSLSCGGYADGSWFYLADSWRFGCGTRVRITNPTTGRSCVARVADVGPNICVERAAGRPVIDASPRVASYLFGESELGWSDRRGVVASIVSASTPLGCSASTPPPPPPAMTDACAAQTDCSSCAMRSPCGWCGGRCRSGSSSGSSDGVCSGSTWAWISSQCSISPAPPPPEACPLSGNPQYFNCASDGASRFRCASGVVTRRESCTRGCEARPAGSDDVCR